MYEIWSYNNPYGDDGKLIHSSTNSGDKVSQANIHDSINDIPLLTMELTLNNPQYGKLKPFKTFIKVWNTLKQRYDFEGRILKPYENMDNSGMHTISYSCEGEMGYLHDTVQRHLEYRGTPKDLLTTILNYHNSQVEDYKKIYVGNMTVTNTTDNSYVYLSGEQTTFEAIKDKLLDRLGGELQLRKVGNKLYLDYLNRIGQDTSTEIRLAKNLLSMSRNVDPTKVITRLTPLGTRLESEDPDATDASEARLTIGSINSGKDYIDRPDLIAEFGIKGGSITWDDVTVVENLKTKGQKFMSEQKPVLNQYTVEALDLSLIGKDIHDFETGNGYLTVNPIMGLNEILRVVGTNKDIVEPHSSSMVIGDKFKTLHQYQAEVRNSQKAIANLKSQLNSLSSRNALLSQSLQAAKEEVAQIQQSLLDVNIENLPTELQGISEQLVGIQNLIDGLEIPEYTPATSTTDGLLSFTDKQKLDLIIATKLVNLDTVSDILIDFENRVSSLESQEPLPPEIP